MSQYFSIPLTGGVNLLDDPRKIQDNEVVRAKNLVPFSKGILGKRPSAQIPAEFMNLVSPGNSVAVEDLLPRSAFFSPITRPSAGYSFFAANTSKVFEVSTPTISNKSWGSPAPRAPVFFMYAKTLYCLPGGANTTPGWKFNLALDIATDTSAGSSGSAFTFQGTNNSFSPGAACVYRGRAVYGDLGLGYESYLVFADPFDPTLIGNDVRAINARALQIGERSERIVALVEITQTAAGSPSDSALLVLKEYSAYIVNGEPNRTTDTGNPVANLVVSRISYDCGCSSASTVARSPYGVIWAGWDDVWLFTTGSLPIRVGSKIRPLLTENSADLRWRWQGAYSNGFYRLAIFSPGGGSGDIPLGEQWWLDLREGSPQAHQDARWWGPQIFNFVGTGPSGAFNPYPTTTTGTNVFMRDQRAGAVSFLYDLISILDGNGFTQYWIPVQYDCAESRDMALYNDLSLSDYLQVAVGDTLGLEIATELITKEYDFGAGLQRKAFIGLQTDYWTSMTTYLQSQVYVDGGLQSDSSSTLVDPAGFVMGADPLDSTAMSRAFQEAVIWPSTRVVGKTLQFKLSEAAGYFVGNNNDTLCIKLTSSGIVSLVTLTQGTYVDLKALCDHIAARVLAVMGISCSHDVTGSTSGRGGNITFTFGAAVSIQFQSVPAPSTAAIERKSRVLGATLGFATGVNTGSSTTQTTAGVVYYKQISNVKYCNLQVEIDIFNRGPA